MTLKQMLIALILLIPVSMAHAQEADYTKIITQFYNDEVSSWSLDTALLSAIRVRNVIDGGLTPEDILAKNKQWRAEVKTDTHPLVDSVVNTAASDFLRHRVVDAGGTITEVFIMDANGLLVAAASATSDYWQGDKPKYSETFGKGIGALHVSELDVDESMGVYQIQMSHTITDPQTDAAIGAITVGVIADALY